MNKITPKNYRILAVAPSTRGFGFVVLEGSDTLVDWGVKMVDRKSKNQDSLAKVKELIAQNQPGVLVLEDTEGTHRSPRVKTLNKRIIALVAAHKVSVKSFTQKQIREAFFADGQGTKHAIAEIVARRFPDELGSRLPPKRKPWMSEHHNMDIFEAAALALTFRFKKARKSKKTTLNRSCDTKQNTVRSNELA